MVKQSKIISLLLSLIIVLFIAACGGTEQAQEQTSSGTPQDRGKALVEATMIGDRKAPGCATCHSLEGGKVIVGPSLAGISVVAESAVPGKSAEQFLRDSIVDPDAYVTEGFPAGVMYKNYGQDLTEEQINDIVAYLLTLK